MSDTTSNDDDHTGEDEEGGALAERAKRMLDRGKGLAAGVTGAIVDAADDSAAEVQNAATGSPGDDEGAATTAPIVAAATTAVPTGPTDGGPSAAVPSGAGGAGAGTAGPGGSGPGGSGSGPGGSGSGGAGGGDDDEGAFIPGIGMSGANQVALLGLIVAGFMLFGGTIWSFIGGDDDPTGLDEIVAPFEDSLDRETDGNRDRDDQRTVSDDSDTDAGNDGGDNDGDDASAAAATTAAPTTTEAATTTEAETTTTEAETTTTEAETTTTEAETTTTEAAALTLLNVVSESDDTSEFAGLTGLLGLQAALEDTSTERTLFVPSNDAIAQLDQSILAEPGVGERIVNYHVVEGSLTAADLIALDGQDIVTATGLPIKVSVVDGNVTLNGATTVVGADRAADNGVVHVIDLVLEAPTVNEALGLENIEFEVNSAVITAAGQAELQKAVDFFTANADAQASIEGHTDTDGSAELNQTLSEDRAAAVKDFLVAAGLEADRFTTAGFGETQPILGEDGAEDKSASRRIEFILQ